MRVYTLDVLVKPNPLNCSSVACLGSVMTQAFTGTTPRSKEKVLYLAKDFLDQYFASIKRGVSNPQLLNCMSESAKSSTIRFRVKNHMGLSIHVLI
ncbi:hypothetical protein M8J77_001062 [Diaphorina citri]|nr:hypothetical protein M8J77_001062 [Diaphorina citri]